MRFTLAALAGAVGLSMVSASPAVAGPPWISIEIPANPYNTATRGAFCLVRVYHHGNAAYYPVQAVAEGLVDGQRRSVKLELRDTGIPGVYALNYEPVRNGAWLLLVRIGEEKEYDGATVVVTLNREGQIASARVPTRQQGSHTIPSVVGPADVDRMLREQVAQVRSETREGEWALAGLAFLPLALVLRRRR